MKGILVLCIISSLLLSGCAPLEPKGEETAQELMDRGMAEFDKGRYRAAIGTFEKMRDWYPFSENAVLAQLRTADAYYELRQYEHAIYAYRAFENHHPGNEATPYVVYRIGASYLARVGAVDRDQASTAEALHAFQRLVKQHPDSDYADKAREGIGECQKSLAGHELGVGLFYLKKKSYRAALHRFNAVLNDYPDAGSDLHRQARQYLALCEEALSAQSSQQ